MRPFLAALSLCLLILTGLSAEARPRLAQIVCTEHGGCSDRVQPAPTGRRGAVAAGSEFTGFGSLAARARQHMGATAAELGLRRTLWCAAFMNKITGGGTGSDLARSFAHFGRPAARGCVDCIAVLTRGRGGHVGVVSGYDARGNPIIISGNHGRRVGESVYSVRRVIAWRYVS